MSAEAVIFHVQNCIPVFTWNLRQNTPTQVGASRTQNGKAQPSPATGTWTKGRAHRTVCAPGRGVRVFAKSQSFSLSRVFGIRICGAVWADVGTRFTSVILGRPGSRSVFFAGLCMAAEFEMAILEREVNLRRPLLFRIFRLSPPTRHQAKIEPFLCVQPRPFPLSWRFLRAFCHGADLFFCSEQLHLMVLMRLRPGRKRFAICVGRIAVVEKPVRSFPQKTRPTLRA